MKISRKQRLTLHRYWKYDWLPPDEAIKAYFDYTDKGIIAKKWCEWDDLYAYICFEDILTTHVQRPTTQKMWYEDFKSMLLFLDDFDIDLTKASDVLSSKYLYELQKDAAFVYRAAIGNISLLQHKIHEWNIDEPKLGYIVTKKS